MLEQKVPLQFSTMSYSIILQGLKNSHNSYGVRAPKSKSISYQLMSRNFMLCGMSCMTQNTQNTLEKPIDEQKNYPWILLQHISTLMVAQIIQSGNTRTHTQNPTRTIRQGLLFDVQNTHLQTHAAFGPSSEAPGLLPPAAVNITIPQHIFEENNIYFLDLVVILYTTTLHWSCKMGIQIYELTVTQFNFSNRHH